ADGVAASQFAEAVAGGNVGGSANILVQGDAMALREQNQARGRRLEMMFHLLKGRGSGEDAVATGILQRMLAGKRGSEATQECGPVHFAVELEQAEFQLRHWRG